jgi:hypothetical protein
MINMTCPHCQHALEIGEKYKGQRGTCKHCLGTITVSEDPPSVIVPAKIKLPPPKCKVCDNGNLIKKEVYRLSWPVVIIGYLLLIPSMACIVLLALGTGSTWLMLLSEPDLLVASMFAGGFTVLFVIIPMLVSSLLGWLLIMKKKILQCSYCSATISAG